ncbi:hypothetical protein VNI00_010916 [Paramarasmius palmivorus]|uniref:Uncharacterized protein n=1 Tax=Paramarasmius palmivorus TaxID=297713 RepID=A0AAW0CHH5_9AGAR
MIFHPCTTAILNPTQGADVTFRLNPEHNSAGPADALVDWNAPEITYEKLASLAAWIFDGTKDNYDVSLVDGLDIPSMITNIKGCPEGSYTVDLNNGADASVRYT